MDDDAFRHQVWSRLEGSLARATSVQDYLQDAVQETAGLTGVEGSFSLSVLVYDHLLTVATTDRAAWDADQVEFDTEAGPCVEALRHGVDTGLVDPRVDDRWPAWAAVTSMLGFQAAAGIPAVLSPGQWIALNLYAPDPDGLAGDRLDRARLFTQEVARTVPTVLRLTEQVQLAEDLQEALANRSTIDQALGRPDGAEPLLPRRGVRHPAAGLPAPQPQAARGRRRRHPALHRAPGRRAAALPAAPTRPRASRAAVRRGVRPLLSPAPPGRLSPAGAAPGRWSRPPSGAPAPAAAR